MIPSNPATKSGLLQLGLASALLCLVGCSTPGLGRVPDTLVELYDQASPSGIIELEIDRDGSIREIEADIPVVDLPAAAVRAADEFAPGASITGAEREILAGGVESYEVKMRHEGRDWEIVVDAQGNVLETEMSLRRSEAPGAVLDAAAAAIADSSFQSVEIIKRDGDDDEYHVKRSKDGASYKVVLTPTGDVIRKVREARAEIEIPLADD